MSNSKEYGSLEKLCVQFDSIATKHLEKLAHFIPDNNGNLPNPWRRNMDYSEWENSPYYGSVSEFLRKFPGGIKDWLSWRNKTSKDRNELWDTKKRVAYLNTLMKVAEEYKPTDEDIEYAEEEATEEQKDKAHNLTLNLIQELIDSGEISPDEVKAFIEKKYGLTSKAHFVSEDSDDAVKEFIDYFKLLLKGKKKRHKKGKK